MTTHRQKQTGTAGNTPARTGRDRYEKYVACSVLHACNMWLEARGIRNLTNNAQ